MKPYHFTNWPDAYDFCREAGHPVVVRITTADEDQTAKIFPSGACHKLVVPREPPENFNPYDPLDTALEACDGEIDLVG